MTHNEYLEKFKGTKPWDKEEFEFQMNFNPSPEYTDDIPFRMTYKKFYLHLRSRIEKGDAHNKD